MGRFSSNSTPISFLFALFVLLSSLHISTSDSPQGACATPFANCFQGTCRTTSTAPFFDCDCDPGWLKFGDLPYCVLPNCTLNFQCGNGAPPPPAPPPPPLFSLPNFSDPCHPLLFPVWCGDGYCEPDGNNHRCNCPDGTGNLMGAPVLPCFKRCSLGGDCNVQIPLPPPPPPTSAAPPKMAPGERSNSANYQTLSTMFLLLGSLLVWT